MKIKIDYKIITIIILAIILIIMCVCYFKDDKSKSINNMQFDMSDIRESENGTDINSESSLENTTTIVNTTSEVKSSLTENLELHTTYYLEECYVQTNQLVKSGENILKYTNGEYLTAPYDCVITQINIPTTQGKCTSEHYIQIESNTVLMVQVSVDETEINEITLGQEATIEIEAYEDKVYEGNVTNISNTATNGKFTVTVEFENDGEVMLGMTSNVKL